MNAVIEKIVGAKLADWRTDPRIAEIRGEVDAAALSLAKAERALDAQNAIVVGRQADLNAAKTPKDANAADERLEKEKAKAEALAKDVDRAKRAVERSHKFAGPITADAQRATAEVLRKEFDKRALKCAAALESLMKAADELKEITDHVREQFPSQPATVMETVYAPLADGTFKAVGTKDVTVALLDRPGLTAQQVFNLPNPVTALWPLLMRRTLGHPNAANATFVIKTIRDWVGK